MPNKIIVKYKDGDVFLHKLSGKENEDMDIINNILKTTSSRAEGEEDENLVVHSIEIIFA